MIESRSRKRFLLLAVVAVAGLCFVWWLPGPGRLATATTIDLERANAEANIVHPNGRTALMVAAREGDKQRVDDLLNAGADVNRPNNNGGTPLMYAVLGGNAEIVRRFLEKGARVNDAAKNGWSPLMLAVTKGYADITTHLLAAGADANQADVYQWTPLMRASYEQRLKIVRLLLKHPATDPDLQGENGITALHIAASQGQEKIARLLVSAKARVDILDHEGRTPYAVAKAAKHYALLSVLQP